MKTTPSTPTPARTRGRDDCPRPGTARYEGLPWPAGVPVLTAADLRTSLPDDGGARKTLLGWLDATFGVWDSALPGGSPVADRFHVNRLATLALQAEWRSRTGVADAVWVWSCGQGVSPVELAACWNAAMASLGFDTSHPRKSHKKGA